MNEKPTYEELEKKIANLQQSERLYRKLFETTMVGLYRTRIEDGRFLIANKSLARMMGYASVDKFMAEYVTSENYADLNRREELLEALQFRRVGVMKAALVVGGGIAGMSASLSLAKQGFDVHLVEKTGELGGNLRKISESLDGYDWQEHLERAIDEVGANNAITVYLESEVDEVDGFVGNFTTRLKRAAMVPAGADSMFA